ncbi:MAG: hypothetical protein E3K29_11355 [Candidatus Brocadia sp.]|nr:hypothetical protein [Candidatus Brocadia sp.]
MQKIYTSYTIYANKRHKRFGRLFEGRFKGIIVDAETYLIVPSRCIHLNPVRAGGKVKKREGEEKVKGHILNIK